MKPLKLSMRAFGPYKDKEVIDFEQLKNEQLFVISGPTGAGKTTIFDAICFALYGTASGSDRQNSQMLRSHFADDDTHTSVTFTFRIHDKTYRVLRQLSHRKAGNKTATGEKYEFFERLADGREVPAVDRQMVTEINKKIEALIGLTESQFKQIVLLPQGEFLRLLTSETENKEAILRRIFQTEKYKDLNQLLQSKRTHIEQKFVSEQKILEHYKSNIAATCKVREGSSLAELLAKDTYNIGQLLKVLEEEKGYLATSIIREEKASKEAQQQVEKITEKWTKAKTINAYFDALAQKEKKYQNLSEEKSLYQEKERALADAKGAAQIIPYEEQYQERSKELKTQEKSLTSALADVESKQKTVEAAKARYEIEKNKEKEREKARQEVEALERFMPIVQEMDKQKAVLATLDKEHQAAIKNVTKMTSSLRKNEEEIERLKKSMEKHESKMNEKGRLTERRNELSRRYKLYQGYSKCRAEEKETKLAYDEAEKQYTAQKNTYETLEQNWLQNQAVVLATHLHDGEACPVCGSNEHPHKATEEENEVTKEQLAAHKKTLEELEKKRREKERTYYEVAAQMKHVISEIKEFDHDMKDVDVATEAIVIEGKEVRRQLDDILASEALLTKEKQALTELEEAVEKLKKAKEHNEQIAQEKQTAFITEKATFQERIRQVPEDIRDLEKLQEVLQRASTFQVELDQAWDQAQKQLQKAENLGIEAEERAKHAATAFHQTKERAEIAKERFKQILEKASFVDLASYQEAKMSEAAIVELDQAIDSYQKQVTTLETEMKQLEETLQGKERMDLEKLQKEVDEKKASYESLFVQLQATKTEHNRLKELMENISASYEKVAAFEKDLAIVDDLYATMRGQNDSRISFERYLQIDYLEQITAAANERFRPLTDNQYHLIRSDRQESHGRQSGLSMDVYDAYTGQTRDVKTLSGGEKFMASLCLALGMSDVIQSFQGGIKIDTMFIDEGFGTLDEETLSKAIDTLINLQASGRMIGVISHVEELKTIFPAMLEVTKTKEGYSKTNFVIK